jgi:hypothetical protein
LGEKVQSSRERGSKFKVQGLGKGKGRERKV